MDRVAVRSRDLAIVGYDSGENTLEVAFRSGGVYRYRGVPSAVFHELMEAPSHGTYFNRHIKDKFPTSKVR